MQTILQLSHLTQFQHPTTTLILRFPEKKMFGGDVVVFQSDVGKPLIHIDHTDMFSPTCETLTQNMFGGGVFAILQGEAGDLTNTHPPPNQALTAHLHPFNTHPFSFNTSATHTPFTNQTHNICPKYLNSGDGMVAIMYNKLGNSHTPYTPLTQPNTQHIEITAHTYPKYLYGSDGVVSIL